MSLEQLERATRALTELYLRLDLPKLWGDGKAVAADGTQYDFYDNNLLAGYHFRYRKMGAVAYRHVANNYIAVFRHFIPPGIWEAVYVIEGLMKAGLSVEADTVYSDTQGQSASEQRGATHVPTVHEGQQMRGYRQTGRTTAQGRAGWAAAKQESEGYRRLLLRAGHPRHPGCIGVAFLWR